MIVFYFEVEVQRTIPTVVAILSENAEQASILPGRLMLCINEVGDEYRGEGLKRFLRNRSKDRLQTDLSNTDTEGIVGYTKEEGLSILVMGDVLIRRALFGVNKFRRRRFRDKWPA